MQMTAHASVPDQIAGNLTPILEAEALVRLAYLYGSVLHRPDPEDVDLAVWAPGTAGVSAFDREAWLNSLALRLERGLVPRRPLDLRLLDRAPAQFRYAVIRTGRLLLARSEVERVRFEADAATLALDLSVGLRAYDRAMLHAIP
jgi:predicted nucleotidyltransferase